MSSLSKKSVRRKAPPFSPWPLIAPDGDALEALAEHLDILGEGFREARRDARKNPDPKIAVFYQALRNRTCAVAAALFDLHDFLRRTE